MNSLIQLKTNCISTITDIHIYRGYIKEGVSNIF
jgi:hypothetical protein